MDPTTAEESCLKHGELLVVSIIESTGQLTGSCFDSQGNDYYPIVPVYGIETMQVQL